MAAGQTDQSTVALVVAAGSGSRFGGATPKQYLPLGGATVLAQAVSAFLRHRAVGSVHVVVAEGDEQRAAAALGPLAAMVTVGQGAATRQQSVRAGLCQIVALAARHGAPAPRRVLIHDAARPVVPAAMIDRVVAALAEAAGACPALPVTDSLRRGGRCIAAPVEREGLWRVQTPQAFDLAAILAAHDRAAESGWAATDDAEVARLGGLEVRIVEGDERAMKITHGPDLALCEAILGMHVRVGSGFDVHAFGPGDHLYLCGMRVAHCAGLVGHSDADVALHALTDALLGALGAGDIGQHFPPSDPQWQGAASEHFVRHAAALVAKAGGRIAHVDITIIAEAPKVGLHRDAMLARLREMLGSATVSLKATTTEGLGFTGRREGIAAQAVATILVPAEGS